MSRSALGSILLALVLSSASTARAESPRERLEILLSNHERVPGREMLLSVSPDAERLLQEIVLKPSARMLARNRAIAVLRAFPGAATARLLREVIHTSARGQGGLARLDLQQALSSYAVVAGPGSLEVIKPFLAHPSQDVRYAAVSAVGLVQSPRALTLLEARRRAEPSAMVRHRLERELGRRRHAR